jgi:hypothetical protein
VFLAVGTAWVFLFVPNPWISILEVQGQERFPRLVYFCLPVILAAVCIFTMTGSLAARVGMALCIPLLNVVSYVLTLGSRASRGEELLAAWFMFIFIVPLYLAGVAIAALISRASLRTTSQNLAVIAVVVVMSFVLLWSSFQWVPLEAMPIVNLVATPLLLGLAAGYLLTGHLLLKLALLVLVPLAHVLVMGGDPAKPGLENLVALIELLALWVGCLVGHIVKRKRSLVAATATPRSPPAHAPLNRGANRADS